MEIEIKLQRGVYAKDVVKSLFAYTECEQTVNCQLLVIKDNQPQVMTVTEIINYQAKKLTGILKAELEFERDELTERLHMSPVQLWQGFFVAPSSVTVLGAEERVPGEAVFRVQTLGDCSHLLSAKEPPSASGFFGNCFAY